MLMCFIIMNYFYIFLCVFVLHFQYVHSQTSRLPESEPVHAQTPAHASFRGPVCHRPSLLVGCSCSLRRLDVRMADPGPSALCVHTARKKRELSEAETERVRWEGTGGGEIF